MKKLLLFICMFSCSFSCFFANAKDKNPLGLKSSYKETITKVKLVKDLVKDYGLVSSQTKDQSQKLQSAINDISKKGGGKLIVPKGTYVFYNVYMNSNVHLVVDKEAVFKPFLGEKTKTNMLNFGVPSDVFKSNGEKETYIENASIRASNGKFTVDYSDVDPNVAWGIRFISCGQVKNFLISDFNVKDAFTTYCSVIFTPAKYKGSRDWSVSRPTNGEIRNISIIDASPGYGLCQLHGAQSLYFEDLYAEGGVTLRLETGAGGDYVGVYDIQAKNIVNKDGKTTLLMGPHIAQNGRVLVDGIKAISTGYAVTMGDGFVGGKHSVNENAIKGRFGDDSRLINIHAVYGEMAQMKTQNLDLFTDEQMKKVKYDNRQYDNLKWFIGPSQGVVREGTKGCYKVEISNVTFEGFSSDIKGIMYAEELEKIEEKNGKGVSRVIDIKPKARFAKKKKDKSVEPTKEKKRKKENKSAKQSKKI